MDISCPHAGAYSSTTGLNLWTGGSGLDASGFGWRDFWREVRFEKPTKLGGRPSVKPVHPKMDCSPR